MFSDVIHGDWNTECRICVILSSVLPALGDLIAASDNAVDHGLQDRSFRSRLTINGNRSIEQKIRKRLCIDKVERLLHHLSVTGDRNRWCSLNSSTPEGDLPADVCLVYLDRQLICHAAGSTIISLLGSNDGVLRNPVNLGDNLSSYRSREVIEGNRPVELVRRERGCGFERVDENIPAAKPVILPDNLISIDIRSDLVSWSDTYRICLRDLEIYHIDVAVILLIISRPHNLGS